MTPDELFLEAIWQAVTDLWAPLTGAVLTVSILAIVLHLIGKHWKK